MKNGGAGSEKLLSERRKRQSVKRSWRGGKKSVVKLDTIKTREKRSCFEARSNAFSPKERIGREQGTSGGLGLLSK